MAPLEDCYSPELAPDEETLRREHEFNAQMLADAGVDLLLVETQNSRREALIAAQCAKNNASVVWVALVPRSADELLSGDSLAETVIDLAKLEVDALLVNCCSPDLARDALLTLQNSVSGIILGAYPNRLGERLSAEAFADWGREIIALGAGIVGGCCGSTPEHISSLVSSIGGYS